MEPVERQITTELWDRGLESGEGLGAVVFLMLSVCVSLIVVLGTIVLCQGPTVVKPF